MLSCLGPGKTNKQESTSTKFSQDCPGSWDCPGIFLRFPGNFVYVFPCSGKKKSTKINFLGPETAGWSGGLPREGVGVEKFVPSLESLSSLAFEGRNLGCPGNSAGISRIPGVVQTVCAKEVCAHFSAPMFI